MIWHYIPQTLLAVRINDMTLYSRLYRQWELMMWPYILQVLLAVWLPVFPDVWNIWHFIPQTSLTAWNLWHLSHFPGNVKYVTFYSTYSHFTGSVKCVTFYPTDLTGSVNMWHVIFTHFTGSVKYVTLYPTYFTGSVCAKCVAFYPTDDIKCA